MRRFLRWLTARECTRLQVAAAFILGDAIGVTSGIRSPFWVTPVVVLVVMAGVAFLTDLLRRISKNTKGS